MDTVANLPPVAGTTAPLYEPLSMSIRELDSWSAYYRDKLRAGLSLTAAESAHRAEVERNINLRHEARRSTISRH